MAIDRSNHPRPGTNGKEDLQEKSGTSSGEITDFFGMDVSSMKPVAQVATGGVVFLGVAGGLIIVNSIIGWWLWWLVFPLLGVLIPSFGLFVKGFAGLFDPDEGKDTSPGNDRERELLEALDRKGELTPAQAAMETTLTVKEADEMMKNLAKDGHLDVRVHGGGIFYALWDHDQK